MRATTLCRATATTLACGVLVALAAAPAASAGVCTGAQAVCSTLAPAKGGVFVLKVYAPKNASITAFDIWTGTKTTAVQPKAICKQHGKADGSQYQLADYYITRCTETIKPGHSQVYCYKGGGGIPFLAQPTTLNAVSIDAGPAGQDDVKAAPAVSACPASVAHRKKHT